MGIRVDVEVGRNRGDGGGIGVRWEVGEVGEGVKWVGLGGEEKYGEGVSGGCFEGWDVGL